MAKHTARWDRRGAGALILVVLIALAIILVLYFAGGNSSYMSQVANTRRQGRQMATDLATNQLTILIAQYRQEQGKLPQSPSDFEDHAAAFKDPWGGPITFTFEESRGGPTKVVYSSPGPDGETGTSDDVTKTETLPF